MTARWCRLTQPEKRRSKNVSGGGSGFMAEACSRVSGCTTIMTCANLARPLRGAPKTVDLSREVCGRLTVRRKTDNC
jgi:hypothetical protein